jgi:hypothetical protein
VTANSVKAPDKSLESDYCSFDFLFSQLAIVPHAFDGHFFLSRFLFRSFLLGLKCVCSFSLKEKMERKTTTSLK